MSQKRVGRVVSKVTQSKWRGILAVSGTVAAILALIVAIPGAPRAQETDSNPNKVLATIGNHKITESEVDQEIKPQLASIQNQIYQARREAIDKLADKYLVDQAAKKAHMTPDEYLKKQLAGKSQTVTDKEAKAFYDQYKSRIQQPYEQIKTRLIEALQRRNDQQVRQQILANLREQNKLKVMIEPPRMKIATAGYPSVGPNDAPVTVVEFADFQCPYCKRSEDTIKELQKEYGDKMRLVFVDFPLSFHQYAFQAAEASHCAAEQGKFWQYHDELFKDQSKLNTKDLKAAAARLGLNTKQFDACLDQHKYADQVRKEQSEGAAAGVDGTPGFFINGRSLTGAQPTAAFETMINEELTHGGQQRTASAKKGDAG
jgi:protein-disulfide isomerase